jgi:hypothetical protein
MKAGTSWLTRCRGIRRGCAHLELYCRGGSGKDESFDARDGDNRRVARTGRSTFEAAALDEDTGGHPYPVGNGRSLVERRNRLRMPL